MVELSEFDNAGYAPEIRQPGEISRSGAVFTAHAPAVTDQAVFLSTKRLTMRPPMKRDRPTVVKLANNIKIAQSLGRMPHPYTLKDADHWIDTLSKPRKLQQTFAITDRYTDEFIGGCGYRPVDGCPDEVTIGYWLGEPYWGNGFAAEAAQALIDHAFENKAIAGLWLTIRASNHQSKRVAEKCGFQFAHKGMADILAINGAVATDHYYMSRSTWQCLHAWGER